MSPEDLGNKRAATTLSGVLGDFFPPDDPLSWWLYRLAVVRDDVAFEVISLAPPSAPDNTEEVWRVTYFLRRISISLLEADSVFAAEVGAFLKNNAAGLDKDEKMKVRGAIQTLNKAKPTLEVIRQAMGGHVRPANVDGVIAKHAKRDGSGALPLAQIERDTRPVEQRVLAEHQDWPCQAVHGPTLGETCYRHLTASGLLFAWPDVKTPGQLDAKVRDICSLLAACVDAALQAIDILLWGWWRERGERTWAAP